MPDFSDVLLTVDYDRTMTAPDSTIPERNLEAIRYFMAHGGAFTINTGRSVPMTKVFRDKVPVNAPLLLYNGSAAYDLAKGEICFCHRIDLPQAETLREVMELLPDITVEIQGLDAHYCFREHPLWDAFTRWNDCALGHAQVSDDLGPFMKFTLYGEFHDDTMAGMYRGTPQELARMDEVEQILNRRYGHCCEVFRAAPRIIDVHAKGVSKYRSARELKEQLGRKILVCVGDGENDVTMLSGADFAYCPGDAIGADRFENVCNCAEGSVADVIYKKIPEILEKKA